MDTQTRVEIQHREPFADGTQFGDVGTYERLAGRVYFALDPDDPANAAVTDLEYVPRNADGLVEYATDLYILKPVDLRAGNGRILYDVNNRGNKRILQFFNDAVHSNDPSAPQHAGNGFLMRRGYSIVWSGWQGNLLPGAGRLTMDVPIATDDGEPITGTTRAEFSVDESGIECLPLSANDHTRSYDTISLDTETATFTKREYERDPRQPIGSDEWAFAHVDGYEPTPSPAHCHYPAGFEPGWLYELVYTAKNPPVLGLGFTGLRDLIAFLRYDETDTAGTPNPLWDDGARMERAYAWGRSQSGRFLREFTYLGFNADPRGRQVFDAISPHVSGGGRVALNYRFGQPGRYPRQHRDHLYPSDQFPFAYDVVTDPLTGKTDGICKRPDTDPLVVHTQTSTEYWARRGSLVHTDPEGNDLGEQDGVRVYLFASSQHHADPLEGPEIGPHKHPSNPLNTTPLLRALLDAMDAWATDGTAPPESRIPSREDGTLVSAAEVSAAFPDIPGVACPEEPNRVHVQDFGPDFDDGIITNQPPKQDADREYAVLVPSVDLDGNDVPGIRTPHVEVPIATHTGWNRRPEGGAERALAGVIGSYLPFAKTEAERTETDDPRPSIAERYPTQPRYVREIALAAKRLMDQRHLLEEDADRYVDQAIEEERLAFEF